MPHTVTTRALERGMKDKVLSKILGHSIAFTMQRYTHVSQDMILQARGTWNTEVARTSVKKARQGTGVQKARSVKRQC